MWSLKKNYKKYVGTNTNKIFWNEWMNEWRKNAKKKDISRSAKYLGNAGREISRMWQTKFNIFIAFVWLCTSNYRQCGVRFNTCIVCGFMVRQTHTTIEVLPTDRGFLFARSVWLQSRGMKTPSIWSGCTFIRIIHTEAYLF